MMQGDAPARDDLILTAIRELHTLSRMPMPLFTTPPWDAICAALPPDIVLPEGSVHVLVDLDIDVTGTVVHAAVGQVPTAIGQQRVEAACVGADGTLTMRPTLDEANPDLAQAVATGYLGAKFTPGERDGHVVPVQSLRLGIEIMPTALRRHASL